MLEFEGNNSLWKVLSAIFYGISSFSIMIINKSVLTSYHFPSFQALSIGETKLLNQLRFSDDSIDIFTQCSKLYQKCVLKWVLVRIAAFCCACYPQI